MMDKDIEHKSTLLPDVADSAAVCSDIDTSQLKSAKSWVKWWTKPAHLSMSCDIDCLVYMYSILRLHGMHTCNCKDMQSAYVISVIIF